MTTPTLTDACQNEFSSAGVVTVLEAGWSAIRSRHSQVPAVVIVLGSGSPARASGTLRWGHFAHSQWQHGRDCLPEVLVSGEGLSRTPAEVLTTLLHEAAHGLAYVRGITDTSRQGRWHNKRFALLAAELGLVASKSEKLGWSTCTLAVGTADQYDQVLDELTAAMSAYRHPDTFTTAGKTATSKVRLLECGCPRRLRVTPATVAEGPILCGVCEQPFTCTDDD
jgi:hypothetical protein